MNSSTDKSIFISGTGVIDLEQIENSKGSNFLSSLILQGFILTKNPRARFYLALDHSRRDYFRFIQAGGHLSRAVLLRLEPAAIFPGEYQPKIEELYTRTITPGALRSGPNSSPEFGWGHFKNVNPLLPRISRDRDSAPITAANVEDDEILKNWHRRKILVSMVVSNKVSPIKTSNYSIRRRLAKDNKDEFIQIFGTLWDESKFAQVRHRLAVLKFSLKNHYFPNLFSIYGGLHNHYFGVKGFVEDKFTILNSSKFTIVIENESTYISEKLFDAIASQTIPIYLGPQLESADFPRGIAIQVTDKNFDVRKVVAGLDDQEALSILKTGRRFLLGSLYNDYWKEESVNLKITQTLVQTFK